MAKGAKDGSSHERAAVALRVVAGLVEPDEGIVGRWLRMLSEYLEDRQEDFVARIRLNEFGRELGLHRRIGAESAEAVETAADLGGIGAGRHGSMVARGRMARGACPMRAWERGRRGVDETTGNAAG